MKIYLPRHELGSRKQSDLQKVGNYSVVGLKELPLAYINTEDVIRTPRVSIEDGFQENVRRYVRPYDSFLSESVYLFDKNNNILPRITMKRSGETYHYEPSNQTEFVPLTFKVYLQLQKQMQYYNDKQYDIKVSCIETTNNLSFANKLISMFGDKYLTGGCPPNIRINGGSLSEMSLIDQDYRTADFVFIESADGIHYGDWYDPDAEGDEGDAEIDFGDILSYHTNVWVSCDNYEDRFTTQTLTDNQDFVLHMTNSVLYNVSEYGIPMTSADIFDQDMEAGEYAFNIMNQRTSYEYINEAIAVLEVPGKGFVIISPKWVLDNLKYTSLMVYETLMYVYLQSYVRTKEKHMWITDQPVDYFSYHSDKYNRTHNKVLIDELLKDIPNIEDDYLIQDVIVDTNYVSYLGLSKNRELLFLKTGGERDPIKQEDEYSFYTTKHTVINYKQEDIATLETILDIEFNVVDSGTYVIVHPYHSSKNRIHTTADQTFKITDYTMRYNLCVDRSSPDIENTFYLLPATDAYSMLASYSIKLSADKKVTVIVNMDNSIVRIDEDGDLVDFTNIDGVTINDYTYRTDVNGDFSSVNSFISKLIIKDSNGETVNLAGQGIVQKTRSVVDRVAIIDFQEESNITTCDTRIKGGGLPIDQPDDFDMLDIGHILGRPYRKGSTLIIRLPSTLKKYDERIRSELNKHIAAGDYYVVTYE